MKALYLHFVQIIGLAWVALFVFVVWLIYKLKTGYDNHRKKHS